MSNVIAFPRCTVRPALRQTTLTDADLARTRSMLLCLAYGDGMPISEDGQIGEPANLPTAPIRPAA